MSEKNGERGVLPCSGASHSPPAGFDVSSVPETVVFHQDRAKRLWALHDLAVRAAKGGELTPLQLADALGKCARAAREIAAIERSAIDLARGRDERGAGSKSGGVTIVIPEKADPGEWRRVVGEEIGEGEGEGET